MSISKPEPSPEGYIYIASFNTVVATMKVLRHRDSVVHVRVLAVGAHGDEPLASDDGRSGTFLIGHLPLDHLLWLDLAPQPVRREIVEPEELAGYRIWSRDAEAMSFLRAGDVEMVLRRAIGGSL